MGNDWTSWPLHLSAPVTSHCCTSARWQEAHPGFAPYGCTSFHVLLLTPKKEENTSTVQRKAPVSQLHVKQYRVPLKTSDKKPIWSPSSNHQFLLQKQPLHFCLSECYSSTGEKRLRIRQKLKKCDNSTVIFMAKGKLVRKELFLDSFEPRNAGSKW